MKMLSPCALYIFKDENICLSNTLVNNILEKREKKWYIIFAIYAPTRRRKTILNRLSGVGLGHKGVVDLLFMQTTSAQLKMNYEDWISHIREVYIDPGYKLDSIINAEKWRSEND